MRIQFSKNLSPEVAVNDRLRSDEVKDMITNVMVCTLIVLFVALCYMLSDYTTEKHGEMSLKKRIAFDLSKMTIAILAGICFANFIGITGKQNFLLTAGICALIIDCGTNIVYLAMHLDKAISR